MGAFGYPGRPGMNGTRGRDGPPGAKGIPALDYISIDYLAGQKGEPGLRLVMG